jgi:hypothetical protein
VPEWAVRAHLSFEVVDPLLMRATYDSIGHHHRPDAMISHEVQDLACNRPICADVALLLDEPTLQGTGRGPLCVHYPNCSFARPCVIGAVEGDRCDWIATKATSRLLPQR